MQDVDMIMLFGFKVANFTLKHKTKVFVGGVLGMGNFVKDSYKYGQNLTGTKYGYANAMYYTLMCY